MPRKTRRKKSGRQNALSGMSNPSGNNPQALLQQLEQMQSRMAEQDFSDEEFTASAGGGMVQVTGKGDGKLTHVAINPEILDPGDADMVQDMVLAAVNDFLGQIQERQQSQMQGLTQGLDLPPGLLD